MSDDVEFALRVDVFSISDISEECFFAAHKRSVSCDSSACLSESAVLSAAIVVLSAKSVQNAYDTSRDTPERQLALSDAVDSSGNGFAMIELKKIMSTH